MAASAPSKFLLRSASGLAAAALLLVLAWSPDWHPAFAAVTLAGVLGALVEFYAIAERLGFEPYKGMGLLLGLALFATGYSPALLLFNASGGLVALGVMAVLALPVLRGGAFIQFSRAGSTLVGAMYVGYLGSFLGVFAASAGPNDLPPLLMLTWVFDSAAMLAGTCLGRTKLSPASPNKSWEGVAGGTAAAAGLALALPQLGFWTDVSVAARLGGALVVGAAAVLGDLTESSLKRETGVKDSSTIRFLPDHGGVLDKMDALLFTAPALWYYLQAVR